MNINRFETVRPRLYSLAVLSATLLLFIPISSSFAANETISSDTKEEMFQESHTKKSAFKAQDRSESKKQKHTNTTITLKQLGLLQLAAHDLFNVDRDTETDTENGKLDLSTLLDYGSDNIALGGEPRNRENIILFTVAKEYGEKYEGYLERGYSTDRAYKKLIKKYHQELKGVYKAVFGEKLPKARPGSVTMTENLALRTIHDLLPGRISVDGQEFVTVDASLIGKALSKKELRVKSSELDGHLDQEFLDVIITIPPDTIMHISLLERDSSFADQFDTEHSFEHFMKELEDGMYTCKLKVH